MDVVCGKMFAPPAQINLLFFALNDPLGNQWRAGSTQLFQSLVPFVVGKTVDVYVHPKACENRGI